MITIHFIDGTELPAGDGEYTINYKYNYITVYGKTNSTIPFAACKEIIHEAQ